MLELIRMTARLKAKAIIANSYETLERKLKAEYPELVRDAAIYKEGETTGFELHHLKDDTKYLVPSTEGKYDKGESNRSKLEQSRYVLAVIDYSKLKNEKDRKEFIVLKNEAGLKVNDKELTRDKIRLDEEMKNSVLIPKEFHGHLHNSRKPIPHARSKKELFEQYQNFRESISLKKLIKESESVRGYVYKEIKAIKRMTDYVLYKYDKQKALKMVDLAFNELLKILKDDKEIKK